MNLKKYRIWFQIDDKPLSFSIEIPILYHNVISSLKFLRGVPIKVEQIDSTQKNEYSISILHNKLYSWVLEKSCLLIQIPFKSTCLSEESLSDILYQFTIFMFIEKNYCILHGTALAKLNNGIVILGESGEGKTDIAIQLIRTYRLSLICDDRVFLNNLSNKLIVLNRDTTIKKRVFKKTQLGTYEVHKKEINIQQKSENLVNLSTIILPKISKFSISIHLTKQHKAIETIAKNILNTLNGTDYCIISADNEFIGFAPQLGLNYPNKLSFLIKAILKSCSFYSVSGSPKFISNEIYKVI